MILVDSSVWIDHLRATSARLCEALERNDVLMHALVIGELACGSLRNRKRLIRQWRDLPRIPSVSDDHAIRFIDRHTIMSRGLGFVDVHLLASAAAKRGTRLWTLDRRLSRVAKELDLEMSPG